MGYTNNNKAFVGRIIGLVLFCFPFAIAAAQDFQAPPPDDAPFISNQTVPAQQNPAALARSSGVPATSGNAWLSIGAGPITGGQVEGIVDGEVIGAIHIVLPHPTNVNIMYIGAVNGGIWRTNNATSASPSWVPLTDGQESLSISAMEFDPTDASYNTIIAAIGTNSSFGSFGGARTGLLRTTDGGASWTSIDGGGTLVGADITGVIARGNTIVVSIDFADIFTFGNIGIFRSTNGGSSFSQVSTGNGTATGLPGGSAYDLASHPDDPSVLYTNINFASSLGGTNGIYKSTDTGASWSLVSDMVMNGLLTSNATSNVEIAIHDSALNNVVYVAILNFGQLVNGGIFRSADGGTTWVEMDVPVTNEVGGAGSGQVGTNPRFKADAGVAGGQGAIHFSIAADPSDPDIVYVGGDRQPAGLNDTGGFPNSIGASNFTGRLFRGDASVAGNGGSSAPSPQWKHLTHTQDAGGMVGGGTANSSAPHADSRSIAFDANDEMIETDDGGIYRRTSPTDNTGDWFSINGDLRVSEMHDIAYDTLNDIVMSGNQDTGTPEQVTTGAAAWATVTQGDGGDVAVDAGDVPGTSVRYSSFQNLGFFIRRTFDQSNTQLSLDVISMTPSSGSAISPVFVTPVATNAVSVGRLLVVGGNGVFESLDRGDSTNQVLSASGLFFRQNAIAYGGTSGGLANPDVIYVGFGNDVYIRTALGSPLTASATYPGVFPRDIVLDSSDWQRAWVIADDGIFHTSDAGGSWTDVTGNFPDPQRNTITFAPCGLTNCVFAGGARGVFEMEVNNPGVWTETGTGLPEAPVHDLIYDLEDGLLAAATMGRGAWTYSLQPQAMCLGQVVTVNLNFGGTPTTGNDVILGTSGADTIDGLGGDDFICGMAGDDVIDGGGGADTISGGSGMDDISGGAGGDTIYGGQDDDMIAGGGGADIISGQAGDDTITGGNGDDEVTGGSGQDVIDGNDGNDMLFGGTDDDTLDGGAGEDDLQGQSGDDTILGGPDADDISGNEGEDNLFGDGGDDLIFGGANIDMIEGGDGNDTIYGQDGRDTINGGSGADNLFGQGGKDNLQGGAGADNLRGGVNDDILEGGSGADFLHGGAGNDSLDGNGDIDICNGWLGNGDVATNCETEIRIP